MVTVITCASAGISGGWTSCTTVRAFSHWGSYALGIDSFLPALISDCSSATVDVQRGSGDEARSGRRQEQHGLCDLLGTRGPPHGQGAPQLVVHLAPFRDDALRAGRPWSDAIDAHSIRSEFHRPRSGERLG